MKKGLLIICVFVLLSGVVSCHEKQKTVAEEVIVARPEQIDVTAEAIIRQSLADLLRSKQLADSLQLKNIPVLDSIYGLHAYHTFWSTDGVSTGPGDSLFSLIQNARSYGLFPGDYHDKHISEVKEMLSDSVRRLDAAKWALHDLLLTSAFVNMVKHLKGGRIVPDSVLLRDTSFHSRPLFNLLQQFRTLPSTNGFTAALEPAHTDYAELKKALHHFLQNASFREFTYVHAFDSAKLRQLVYKRIGEEDSIDLKEQPLDSAALAGAIQQYQKLKKMKPDGRLSSELIKKLNDTDKERFIRVAITMDRYKSLPSLPAKHVWVNIPSFYLKVRRQDTVVLTSKVAVGKTQTRTPEIISAITDMITYPQWTIPASIIEKEILPGLRRDAGYTQRKGYSIIDASGNEVDPYLVDWSKYKKGIPYKVVQGSGDANALGVIKFNFPNKHSVYLHDTNQRYLFSRKHRALSHGCVRVESWRELAAFILENDSLSSSRFTPKDSLDRWLSIKQKKVIPVQDKLPVLIKYFTCEGVEGKLVFYDDIYDEDRRIRNRYFATK